ncbi:MAG: thioredoxin family protein [Gammaproteobacteria bacterium]|nr:thioredoxin family protein [Gammaproteobacteria bacterium]
MRVFRLGFLSLVAVSLSACFGDASNLKVGSMAPLVQTKTLANVNGDLSKITTYRYPDKRMYQYSVDDALKLGKPVVLEFATPAHCTQCDKQLQLLKAVLDKYEDDVVFLHMDQYKNPEAFKAYKVLGDPWTFVIDQNQVVRYKLAGRLLYGEIDALIKDVLKIPARAAPANSTPAKSAEIAAAG